ncbi:hypothetical protein BKA63DRAFT_153652 [Paraphoma chrysanthemicola]|nr:hypothetical protein BKA63DRAFT_153652 [Paraphoma chrysanthemicola]
MDPWTEPPTQAVARQYHATAAQSQTTVDPIPEESDELMLATLGVMDSRAPTLTGPGLDNALAASQPCQLDDGKAQIFFPYAPTIRPFPYAPPPQPSTLQLNDAQFRQSSEQSQTFAPELAGYSLPLPDESRQLNEYEVSAYFPEVLQSQPSVTAWTAFQPLQLVDQSQSVLSQAPSHSLPPLDGMDLQLNTASDHHASTNQPCHDPSNVHLNMLSHGHDQLWGNINTTFNPDAISQGIPYRNHVGLPYGPVSGVWPTHTPLLAASDQPLLPDFPQPQNYPNPWSANSQDSFGYHPTQFQASTVPAIYGSSSQNAHGRWLQTSDQTSQYRSQELFAYPHCAELTSHQFASQFTSSPLIVSDSSASVPNDALQDVSHNVVPYQANSASEYPTFHAPSSSHAPYTQGTTSATKASSCVGLSAPLHSRKAISGATREVPNTSLILERQQKSSSATIVGRHRKLEQKLKWCPSPGPTSKHGQDQAKKRVNNNYGKVKSACYWCKRNRRGCDGPNKTLCSPCERYIRNLYGSQFRVPKFTCDVRTKFEDLDLIPCGSIIEELDEKSRKTLHRIMVLSDGDEVQSFLTKFKPVFDFLDCLEPQHARQILKQESRAIAPYFSYIQGVIRWKDFFIEFRPDLKPMILTMVAIHSEFLRLQLHVFDLVFVPKEIKEVMFWFHAILYKEIPVMRCFINANEAAVEHFRSALEHRLVFTMGDMFGAQSTKTLPKELLVTRANLFCLISGDPSLLPPQYRSRQASPRWSWPGFEDHHKCPGELNQSDRGIDMPCICSPMMHCLPSHALICLGFDLSAIAQELHNNRELLVPPLFRSFRQSLCSSTGKSYLSAQNTFRLTFAHILKTFLDELTVENLFVSKPNSCPVFSLRFLFKHIGPPFLLNVLLSFRHFQCAIRKVRNEKMLLNSMGDRIHLEGEKTEVYKQLRDHLRQIVRELRELQDILQEVHGYCEGNRDLAMALKYKE